MKWIPSFLGHVLSHSSSTHLFNSQFKSTQVLKRKGFFRFSKSISSTATHDYSSNIDDSASRVIPLSSKSSSTGRTGLFGYPELEKPSGFRKMAENAVFRSEGLIQELKTSPPSMATIQLLDEMSDSLCTVLDAAELCRNTNTDREFVLAANEAYMHLAQYVQYLNTSQDLYRAVKASMDAFGEKMTPEAARVGSMLMMDFERGGVHLPDEKRQKVQELNNEITVLGMQFGQNIAADTSFLDIFPASKLDSVPDNIRSMFGKVKRVNGEVIELENSSGFSRSSSSHGYRVKANGLFVSSILKWAPDESVRKAVYIAGSSTPVKNIAVLDKLIATRHELAEILGYKSYAHFQCGPLLARSPENVIKFLEDLSDRIRPKADEELRLLEGYKRRLLKIESNKETDGPVNIFAWDTAFFTGLARARANNLDARVISRYFTVQGCLDGLAMIVSSLFGIQMSRADLPAGESWHDDVIKLALTHPDNGPVGYIYLDLHPRPNKYGHAAHFTLKCGRNLLDGSYQLPVVALVLNFPKSRTGGLCSLGHGEVETLFHEFGHAMHSILSKTEFQHLSGTRTALDFVETPSNLFEYFAWDHRVLKRFARHVSTGEPIPEQLVANMRQSSLMFSARDIQSQLIFALSDQSLFGRQPLEGGVTASLARINDRHSSVRHVAGTHWETHFSHFVGYGASYYSYLYAKCFASEIWKTYLKDDPLDSGAGRVLQEKLFRHGGAKDPVDILNDLLNRPGGDGVKDLSRIVPNADQFLHERGLL